MINRHFKTLKGQSTHQSYLMKNLICALPPTESMNSFQIDFYDLAKNFKKV